MADDDEGLNFDELLELDHREKAEDLEYQAAREDELWDAMLERADFASTSLSQDELERYLKDHLWREEQKRIWGENIRRALRRERNRKRPWGRPKLDPERNERLVKQMLKCLTRHPDWSLNSAANDVVKKERIKRKTLLNIFGNSPEKALWLARKKHT